MQIWIIGGIIIAFLCVILGVVMLINTDRPAEAVGDTESITEKGAAAGKEDYRDDPQLITVEPYPSSQSD